MKKVEMKVSERVVMEVRGYPDGWGDGLPAAVFVTVGVRGEWTVDLPNMSPGQARILADALNRVAFHAEGGDA